MFHLVTLALFVRLDKRNKGEKVYKGDPIAKPLKNLTSPTTMDWGQSTTPVSIPAG